jgi:hypothetical protein
MTTQEQEVPGNSPEENETEDIDTEEPGGGLTADDLAQPTTTADTTGDRATGLTGLQGG